MIVIDITAVAVAKVRQRPSRPFPKAILEPKSTQFGDHKLIQKIVYPLLQQPQHLYNSQADILVLDRKLFKRERLCFEDEDFSYLKNNH